MTEIYGKTMKINEPHTAHATPVASAWADTRRLAGGWHVICPPPPPPPPTQVVDFKQVTTSNTLLFTRLSSKYISFRLISAAEQTSRRADTARRGVSARVRFDCIEIAVNYNTDFEDILKGFTYK